MYVLILKKKLKNFNDFSKTQSIFEIFLKVKRVSLKVINYVITWNITTN